ncbi:uncharacterized protein OCT59_012769 [Rhizophagus irregularis]|uniref:uncharacterized protein n=1 Tax=Rhizophagus irregularis TaxID=588596 RepID=UPI00331B8227|nr:hypothetical protein OCT59_012769 [Rhizophagus irregularis]
MEEFMISDDVFEQIKNFDHEDLTEKQSLLIDKLILTEELKIRYKENGLCKECKQPNTGYTWCNSYITSDFLREIETHIILSEHIGNNIAWCYGITKDPESRNFMIVMGYVQNGSLRQHLNNTFNSTKWNQKLMILRQIAQGLDNIHQKGQIEEADNINEKLTSSSSLYIGPALSYTTNPQAVYTSRLLDFKNLPEPKNAIDNKDDNSFGEYSEAIDFIKLDLDKSS